MHTLYPSAPSILTSKNNEDFVNGTFSFQNQVTMTTTISSFTHTTHFLYNCIFNLKEARKISTELEHILKIQVLIK